MISHKRCLVDYPIFLKQHSFYNRLYRDISIKIMMTEQSEEITRFGKERMKLYSMFFLPSLVEDIDAKRGLVDRSTWIRDKLFHILSQLEYESKSGLEAPFKK